MVVPYFLIFMPPEKCTDCTEWYKLYEIVQIVLTVRISELEKQILLLLENCAQKFFLEKCATAMPYGLYGTLQLN